MLNQLLNLISPLASRELLIKGVESALRAEFLRRLEKLCRGGQTLNVIYDIGAHTGEWSKNMSRSFPQSAFYCFEANPVHQQQLGKLPFESFIVALHSESTEREIYQIGGTGDSFFREMSAHYEGIEGSIVKTETLDRFVRDRQLPLPQLIKIDTQGSELDILRGAPEILAHASMVYLECSLVPYNLGAPDFSTVLSFMDSAGFEPATLGEIHRSSDSLRLLQLDILFLKKCR